MNIKTLRYVGVLEGLSFLFLLFIAMPLKYIWDYPIVVKYAGMIHGALFLLFVFMLYREREKYLWSSSVFWQGLIAAILPFAPFWFDKKLKELEQQKY